jgi:WD40 repeat protein
VSGSKDKTIRIWDARTGEEVMTPLEGHTGLVTSVGFSPDGTHIVSGSDDKTIRIWDAKTGEEVLKPLEGHTGLVTSVDSSPDGTRIVSGSADKTIHIWDAKTGGMIMEPLEGHTDWVTFVGFSPDGTHIVSGSYDKTIRIWDARAGEQVMKPLERDTSSIIPDIGLIASPHNSSVLPNLQSSLQSGLFSGSLSRADGWIRGSHQELLFWVIPEWRDFVLCHPCILIIGQSRVRFDLQHYVHGMEWARCISKA